MPWPGFDGRAYTREQWIAHVAETPMFPGAKGIVEHATGIPTLAQWLTYKNEDTYLDNTQRYYEDSLHWSHGPHWFASPWHICGFSALNVRGTHCSCHNYDMYGGEAAGNRNTEDFTSGPGKDCLDNWHFAAATIFIKLGIKPSKTALLPHSSCKADGHFQCPIENWERDFRASETAVIITLMNAIGDKLVVNPSLAAQATPLRPIAPAPTIGSAAWIQAALNGLGTSPALIVDGDVGRATSAAIAEFQISHALHVDGIAGAQTVAALEVASA